MAHPDNADNAGDSHAAERERMVVRQIEARGISDALVLAALRAVPREAFVPVGERAFAYEDHPLPIGAGQTISQPYIVALTTAGLGLRGGERVLEIGTGCGYQAALLAQQARRVVSIERLRPLHDKARELLGPLRLDRVRLVYGDGMQGHAPNAPYDSIIAAAGGEALPQAWLDQLAVGGRLVAPLARPGQRDQVLVVVDRRADGYVHQVHEAVKFVPLKSGRSG